jgi:hypothetical protein
MSNAFTKPAVADADYGIMERVLAVGDLAKLSPDERSQYYMKTCESMGLNPLTTPFGYLNLNGQLRLYATKNCTDQLRKTHGVSILGLERSVAGDLAIVTASAKLPDGREDSDMGAVDIKGLSGEKLANAWLKCVTKAKRRVTLSIVGLGMLDESEIDSIPGARQVAVSPRGEIVGHSDSAEDPQAEHAAALLTRLDKLKTKAELVPIAEEIAPIKVATFPGLWARYFERRAEFAETSEEMATLMQTIGAAGLPQPQQLGLRKPCRVALDRIHAAAKTATPPPAKAAEDHADPACYSCGSALDPATTKTIKVSGIHYQICDACDAAGDA